ncbi:MAG: phosphoglycolate phosphatase [Gammaproteobacteria bacterium]|nr:phosphoglycolate phosphatase [Gammaproteobacteria bacterium]
MSVPRIDAVLLDLDGTLADTAPDLAATLNHILEEEGLAPLPFTGIRPFVSNGANGLLRLGFGANIRQRELDRLRGRFLDLYAAALCQDTCLFPGFAEVLDELDNTGRKWGVVTNKPAYLTGPLLETLGLDGRAACMVSGDTLTEKKPHPLPLLHAAELMQAKAAACVYVGDAERDIRAGLAAGMQTLIASYGYIETGATPDTWGAHGVIDEPAGLLTWLASRDQGVKLVHHR